MAVIQGCGTNLVPCPATNALACTACMHCHAMAPMHAALTARQLISCANQGGDTGSTLAQPQRAGTHVASDCA